MRSVIQRVLRASVTVDNLVVSTIGKGFLVLLGVENNDTLADASVMADKIATLRVFNDEYGKMNDSILDIQGEILLVSQFTLHGDCRHGRRPSFIMAAHPDLAIPLYEKVCTLLQDKHKIQTKTGIFGAKMEVALINDGPVTLLVDTKKIF